MSIVIGPLTATTIIAPGIAHLVTSPPSVLFAKTEFVRENLRDQRIREDEILATIRASGHALAESVQAIVLESTGDLSVIAASVPEKRVEQDRPMLQSLDR